jgi:transcription elongation GreA/GreB family factor/predicted nucleic acid-binding protein
LIEVLSSHWHPGEREHRQLIIADLLLWAYHQTSNSPAVDAVLRVLEQEWRNDPDAQRAIAQQRVREGNAAVGINLLREMVANVQEGQQRDRLLLELGNICFDASDWSGAAEAYEEIVDKSTINPLSVKYLLSLFNSGSYREAFTLATSLRNGGTAIPVVSEAEAQLLAFAGDLVQSLNLFVQLRDLEPQKVLHRLWIADLQRRIGEREAARNTIESIRFEEIKEVPELLMRVAVTRLHLGMNDFLPLAYRARRLAFDDPNVHIAYLGLFLNRETSDDDGLHPTRVDVDCAVHLENRHGKRVFLIVNQEPIDLYRGEIAPTDPKAIKLLGRTVGDEVVLRDNQLEEVSFRISDIQSKYVYAFQETGSQFSTLFPDNPAFSSIDTSGGDFSKIFAMLDWSAERGVQVLGLYRENRFPLSAIARLLNHTLIEMWAGLIESKNTLIYASTGHDIDDVRESEMMNHTDTIVLDLSALLTICHLNLLDALKKRFQRILVAQAVLDEVNEQFSKERLSGKQSNTIWKEGEHYAYQEITEEHRSRRQSFLELLRNFIETTAEVVPAMGALDIPKKEYEHLESLLGDGPIASILAANERNALLYADDLGLRQMAAQDWQVHGVWTQTVLESMRKRGILSLAEYYDALRKLIIAGYNFVRIDVRGLLWILRHNQMKASPEMKRVLTILSGPNCDEMSAIIVSAEFTYFMWLQVPIYEEKIQLLEYILNAILTGRVSTYIIPMFKAALQAKFATFPKPLQAIFEQIDSVTSQNKD